MERISYKTSAKGCMLHVTKVTNPMATDVIVFVHGGPGSGAQPIMDLLAMKKLESAFSAIYYDQRGSGESVYDLSLGLSIEQITDDLKLIVDHAKTQFKGQKIHLWGGSFGGLFTLLFLKRFPKAVDKAVICCPAINLSDETVQQSKFEMLKDSAEEIFSPEVAAKLNTYEKSVEGLKAFMECDELKAYLKSFERPPVGNEAIFHIHAMRHWLSTDSDMRSSIGEIEIPTLLLQGMEDPICPASILIDAFKKYRNDLVHLKTFSPCGHGIFEDCTEDFCNACINFYFS